MGAFGDMNNNTAMQVVFAFQAMLIIFFVVSPVVGKLMHAAVAKASSLVLIVCSMILVGNLMYMGMVYVIYPIFPEGSIHPYAWIIMSFCCAFSVSILLGRYMNWMLSDNFNASIWADEYENLTEDDMMPFDRKRKREMKRRKRALHQE